MKLNRSKRDHSLRFNMTPMIDIVFLLIIFFMTVSQITKSTEQPLNLPVVRQGTAESKMTDVTINVRPDGTMMILGAAAEMDVVIQRVEEALLEANSDPTQVKIQIRCDKNARSKQVNELFKELARLGFIHVKVAVTSE